MTIRLPPFVLLWLLAATPAVTDSSLAQEGPAGTFILCDSPTDLQQLINRLAGQTSVEPGTAEGLACREAPLTGSGFRMEAVITEFGEPVTGPGLSCLAAGCEVYPDAAGYIRGSVAEAEAFAVLPVEFVEQMLEAAISGGGDAGADGNAGEP